MRGFARYLALALFLAVAAVFPAVAQQTVPIAQSASDDGIYRYWVPVYIGSSEMIRAQLDTGSTGLRILRSATEAYNYKVSADTDSKTFSNGVVMNGSIAYAHVRIGDGAATRGEVPLEVVTSVHCTEDHPKCPARDASLGEGKLVAGDGFSHEGFDAILGIGMRPEQWLINPLMQVDGNHRWIVQLPRPSRDQVFGALIVNPTERIFKNYWLMKLKPQGKNAWQDNNLKGCIIDQNGERKTCMDAMFDTGTASMKLRLKELEKPGPWAISAGATMTLAGEDQVGDPATLDLASDNPKGGSIDAVPGDKDFLNLGVFPYYIFSILYDGTDGAIGIGSPLLGGG